jgi:hypothetical protein
VVGALAVAVAAAGDVAFVAAGFPNKAEALLEVVAGVTTKEGIAGACDAVAGCNEAAGCDEAGWFGGAEPKRLAAGFALLNKLAAGA